MINCPILIIEIILNPNHRTSISWLKLHLSPYPQIPIDSYLLPDFILLLSKGRGICRSADTPMDGLLVYSILHQLFEVSRGRWHLLLN